MSMTGQPVVESEDVISPAENFGAKLKIIRRELREEYLQPHDKPWIIGFSGGKDLIRRNDLYRISQRTSRKAPLRIAQQQQNVAVLREEFGDGPVRRH